MRAAFLLLMLTLASIGCTDNLRNIYEKESAATVKISDSLGHGSGFQISSGVIVTAAHVISQSKNFTVLFKDGKTFTSSEYYYVNYTTDIAIIKIPDNVEPCLRMNKSRQLVTTSIYITGYPRHMDMIFSKGMITGYSPEDTGENYIFDAPINFGNSGGPIVNDKCEVIGIVDAMMQDANALYFGLETYNFPKYSKLATNF